jgi:hypothetical protein
MFPGRCKSGRQLPFFCVARHIASFGIFSRFSACWIDLDQVADSIASVTFSISNRRWKDMYMAQVSKDQGVIAVLAKRMVEERLPKALALKERIDRGEVLNELDLNFLEQVVADANQARPLMRDNPRVLEVAGRMLQLYKEITEKALENEKAKK